MALGWKKLVRFRLRTLLIAITVACLPLVWIVRERMQFQRELEIARRLESQGMDSEFMSWFGTGYDDQSWWQKPITQLLGGRINRVSPSDDRASTIDSVEPFTQLARLESLVFDSPAVHDLSPLERLPSLKTLVFFEPGDWSKKRIRLPPNLESLVTRIASPVDLGFLRQAPQLYSLEIFCSTNIDFTPLADLHELERFTLKCSEPVSLTTLSQLTELKKLTLFSSTSDLSWIAGLESLEQFSCFDSPVSDLTPLSNLHHLRLVFFRGSQVTDLSPLVACRDLEKVAFAGAPLRDLSPLHSLPNLRLLHLLDLEQLDLNTLAGFKYLEVLALTVRKDSTNLSPLAKLEYLNNLRLEGTGKVDLMPLFGLYRLKQLDLDKLEVDEAQVKQLMQLRPGLGISH